MSPRNFVESVQIPFLALNAIDDPIAPSPAIPYEAPKTNANVAIATTQGGGHLGWFSGSFAFVTKRRWVVDPIIEFLVLAHEREPSPTAQVDPTKAEKPDLQDGMVMHPDDQECGFREVGSETVQGADDEGEASVLTQGL